jgi:very-short-patch-repair endonuclease
MPRKRQAPSVTDTLYAKPGRSRLSRDVGLYHDPILTHGPRDLRGHAPDADDMPPGWNGTDLEFMVNQSLINHGLQQNVNFQYQSSLLGGHNLGGIVADFIIFDPAIVINIQGDIWHYGMGQERIQSDIIQRALLEAMGYSVVFIDEKDIYDNVDYYVEEALKGHDHSKSVH